jgi:hypothetical protein
MFEREIKFIYDFNLNKVKRLGPYFTFEQLSTTDIHPAIFHYISAEIDFLVFEDRQKLLKNSAFDYSGEKISYSFVQITEELKKTKRFSLEYVAKLILHASSFTINYLIRPKWTLSKFVFDESNHKSTNEIKQILNYIYYYKYLIKIITSYINTKKILSMNVEEFETLLNKADKLGVESYLPNIIITSLKSMAEFFNIGEVKKLRIPLMAVELFLEEKELTKHLDILNDNFGNDENAKFNIYDFQRVLSSVMIEKSETPPKAKETTQFEIIPVKADLPDDKFISKEPPEIIPEEKIEAEPIPEELKDTDYVPDQINEAREEESEEELMREKYADENEINNKEENEEEVLPLEEYIDENNLDKLNETSGNEPDKFENFVIDENEEKLIQDQDQEKHQASKQDQEQAQNYMQDTEQEHNETKEQGKDAEKETGDNALIESNEQISTKIEEIEALEEEIKIKLNTKFRIRVNEDNRIEPVIEEPKVEPDDYKFFEEEPENLQDKFIGGKSIIEDEIEASNLQAIDELVNIIPDETVMTDARIDNSEEIIPESDELEEHENTITNEKKDTFEFEIESEKEKIQGIDSASEDEFFDLSVSVKPNIIEEEIPEEKKLFIFDDVGLENNSVDKKESEKNPEDTIEESKLDQSNFIDIFNKEIKLLDDDEVDSDTRTAEKQGEKIDVAEILEHNDMTKIIELIFDYDIEDFANTIEEIANCKNIYEANILLKDILAERRINRHSKEVEAFRSIIQELFN